MTERETDPDDYRDLQRDWAAELAAIPEPRELTVQAEALAAERARQAELCVTCGRPRSLHGFRASSNAVGCNFQGEDQ